MIVYPEVNDYLPSLPYVPDMGEVKPGSKKGVPKPRKRKQDMGFVARLDQAIKGKFPEGITNAELARRIPCTKQAIGKYRSGASRSIDAFLLFAIADYLGVSPRWLLLDTGTAKTARTTRREALEHA